MFAAATAHWLNLTCASNSLLGVPRVHSFSSSQARSKKQDNQLYGQIRRNAALLRPLRSVTHHKHSGRSAFADR